MTKKLEEIDPAMGFVTVNRDGMDWHTVDSPGFELNGFYWRKPGEILRRLPESVKITEELDILAWNTAGGMLRFRSDTSDIRIAAQLDHAFKNSDIGTAVGGCGFDLYLGQGAAKTFHRVTRFDATADEYTVPIFGPAPVKKIREFTIHFPLYSGLKKLEFGLTPGAQILPPTPWPDPRPIVLYGTSIEQGGCASRPGMCPTNQMSRLLNRPFLNFGFSGNGRGQKEAAEILAEIADPAMYVLEYDANAGDAAGLRQTLPVFVETLRLKHPDTPILLVSKTPTAGELKDDAGYPESRRELTETHLSVLAQRRAMGDQNVHFLDGTALYGPDPTECTVDGCHATDLGFYFESRRMAPVIARILG
ncbi:MAG: hypothetical protein E7055_02130 [Lentisphaerae bacterium]|nr:hypothetical protein [Lentisphaerota bacterium]